MKAADRIGGYEVIRPLGRGGMAEVVLARRAGADGFQREVVIKRILSDYAAEPRFVDMFRDEAHITALLRHGNIAQVIEFGEDQGDYFLVLEFIDGAPLSSILESLHGKGKRLPPLLVAYVLSELGRALDYAHRKRGADGELLGVVHRDVSPGNTLVSREGEVKLADFGIARARERLTSTRTGAIKGKLAYMSPEMLENKAEPRSDLFSLGAMGWEMCTGSPPFEGDTFQERVMLILEGVEGSLADVSPETPPALSAIIDRLLQNDKAKRPARASEVTDALGPLLASAKKPASEMLAELVEELVPPPRTNPEPTVLGPPRVVVVERSVTARALVRAALGKGVEVVEVDEPDAAMEALAGGRVAMVVSQYRLSGSRTGLDLCADLRKKGGEPPVPFVLTVSEREPEVEEGARAAGVTAVVTKAEPQQLLKKLREIAGGLASPPSERSPSSRRETPPSRR